MHPPLRLDRHNSSRLCARFGFAQPALHASPVIDDVHSGLCEVKLGSAGRCQLECTFTQSFLGFVDSFSGRSVELQRRGLEGACQNRKILIRLELSQRQDTDRIVSQV